MGEAVVGTLIGEIAMMNPEKGTRLLSGMAKTDCIFLLLNHDAFEILVKVKFINNTFRKNKRKLMRPQLN